MKNIDIREFIKNELKDFDVPMGFCGGCFPLIFVHLRKDKSLGKIEVRRPDGKNYFIEIGDYFNEKIK